VPNRDADAARKCRARSDSAIEESSDEASATSNSVDDRESLAPIRPSEIDFAVRAPFARRNFQQRNFVDEGCARSAGARAK
jgi:hypothetical protein